MKVKIPKDMRGFAYPRVLPFEANDFEIDLLLPMLFFAVVSGGNDRARRANDATLIPHYLGELANHESVDGFKDEEGRRLLGRLVRTSLVQLGRKGADRTAEQIQSIVPYSYLSFKPGLPAESSLVRNVDKLVYRMMRNRMRGDVALHRFFSQVFGVGVTVSGGHIPTGAYDERTPLDSMTRLSLAYLDGFVPTGVRPAKEQPAHEACPALAAGMASDLHRFLWSYHDRMPSESLTYSFKALINFELFVYSVKLFAAVEALVASPESLPKTMDRGAASSPPELYLDFASSDGGLSREMARSCVRRDTEQIHRFVAANLTLRQLDGYVRRLKTGKAGQIVAEALGDGPSGPEYLQRLLMLRDDPVVGPRIEASAALDAERIEEENVLQDAEEGATGSLIDFLTQIGGGGETEFDRVVLLIIESQRSKTARNVTAWYTSVGGLSKPHGILSGHPRSRHSWRYAPSNDLLAVLVQLAAVDIPKWDHDDPQPRPIRLRDFLGWLEARFGILVDRPPAGFAGAEATAAAQENLRAMLRRLRQMGVFRDLSDDFTVQRLEPPYLNVAARESGREGVAG